VSQQDAQMALQEDQVDRNRLDADNDGQACEDCDYSASAEDGSGNGAEDTANGAELLDSAREVFTTSLHTVAGLGAVIFVALAVVAATVLHDLRAVGKDTGAEVEVLPEPVEAAA
jgi:hypothetical protein